MKGGDDMDVAQKIKEYIEANGLKQTFVAEKSGIDNATLNAILNGKIRLTVDRLQLICEALNVKPEFFLSQNS